MVPNWRAVIARNILGARAFTGVLHRVSLCPFRSALHALSRRVRRGLWPRFGNGKRVGFESITQGGHFRLQQGVTSTQLSCAAAPAPARQPSGHASNDEPDQNGREDDEKKRCGKTERQRIETDIDAMTIGGGECRRQNEKGQIEEPEKRLHLPGSFVSASSAGRPSYGTRLSSPSVTGRRRWNRLAVRAAPSRS